MAWLEILQPSLSGLTTLRPPNPALKAPGYSHLSRRDKPDGINVMPSPGWRHLPWISAVALAPILHGSVTPGGQAVVGLLMGISWLLLAAEADARASRPRVSILRALWILLLLFPLLPLPPSIVGWLQPGTLEIWNAFPIDAQAPVRWLPLSLSPAASWQRLWELALVVSSFFLARRASAASGVPRTLVIALASALLALAAADVWLRLHGHRNILGIWRVTSDHAAGTFANRNHFANWIFVVCLFLFGAVVRALLPLKTVRRSESRPQAEPTFGGLILAASLPAFVCAIASGSRSALIAFLGGLACWIVQLLRHSRSRRRFLLTLGLGLALATLVLMSGELVFARLGSVLADFKFKTKIWIDAWRMFCRFPLFGTGLGSFMPAFNHCKTFAGTQTFWHAENDYLQLLVEMGLAGAALIAAFLVRNSARIRTALSRPGQREPELFWGALAGLAAFAVQACLDFPFQIEANALLAATLAGLAAGFAPAAPESAERGQPSAPIVPSWRVWWNRMGALSIIGLALAQGLASAAWFQARTKTPIETRLHLMDRSVRLWPFDMSHQLARLRAQAASLQLLQGSARGAASKKILQEFDQILARDPFNWEIRLERAWFLLAFFPENPRGREEAWQTLKLNPLQPLIPLGFAEYFAPTDRALALAFVRAAAASTPEAWHRALKLTWQITADSSQLWPVVPATPEGLAVLGDFALEQKLLPMAVAIFQRLENVVPRETLAEKYLQAGRSDLAIGILQNRPLTPSGKLVLSRAFFAAGQYHEARKQAEAIWLVSVRKNEIVLPPPSSAGRLSEQSTEERRADELAEAVSLRPASDANWRELQELVRRFPHHLRVRWLLVQSAVELGNDQAAADEAIRLARQVLARDERL